ncbi:MAG: Flp pilus assembly protein CpaB [Sphingomonadaceae bacterium]
MDVKKIALLVGALLIAAVTAVMAKNMFTGSSAPEATASAAAVEGPEVLVATRTLPVGTIIDAEALRFQRWPEGLVEAAYYIKGQPGAEPAELLGTVVRNEITAGQPLTQGALIKPGERGFLAAALGPGMRAITVPVSATSGVAGFIFPGDRVDIVLTQEVEGGGEGPPLKASETILRNLRVLAIDQRTNTVDEQGNAVAQTVSNVTIEVTPKIAEKIAVAQTIGQLSLSLRSIADTTAELERAIAAGEVEVPEDDDPNAERRMLLAIAQKPIDSNPTATVGGEVSRFQRSTVPTKSKQRQDSSPGSVPPFYAAMPPAPGNQGGGQADAADKSKKPDGPSVRVARGNDVSYVPVGSK